jgi:hypothetical protein
MVGYSLDANLNPVEVLGMLPGLVTVLGAGSLISQMARSMNDILAMPGVKNQTQSVYGAMTPDVRPDLADTMDLKQRADGGDVQAKAELAKLEADPRATSLVSEAKEKLSSTGK